MICSEVNRFALICPLRVGRTPILSRTKRGCQQPCASPSPTPPAPSGPLFGLSSGGGRTPTSHPRAPALWRPVCWQRLASRKSWPAGAQTSPREWEARLHGRLPRFQAPPARRPTPDACSGMIRSPPSSARRRADVAARNGIKLDDIVGRLKRHAFTDITEGNGQPRERGPKRPRPRSSTSATAREVVPDGDAHGLG